jgi:uncharacterized membrane protein
MRTLLHIVGGRPRLFISAAIGLAVALLLLLVGHAPITRALLAWDAGCIAFILLSAQMFTSERHADIAVDAARQEEGEWTIFWLTVGGVAASFAAIIVEFSSNKDMPAGARDLHIALVAVTLLVSWLTTHMTFAYRYAHEYYERDGNGKIAGGLLFPDEAEPDYWDFFYFALVLGMTFQVSDVQITSRKLRRLAAAHGFLAFLFNTVVLALSVNIGASLM